jgi:diadenosine tetraphosphate (Ap4A) HIT family hydrolase
VQANYGHREAGCVFCALEGSGRVLLENELALCISDAYPVSERHSLVIPQRDNTSKAVINTSKQSIMNEPRSIHFSRSAP